jgi:phosphatidylserine/phosphatidylglycerophosphate/cardiolipin synthase-like enzyme
LALVKLSKEPQKQNRKQIMQNAVAFSDNDIVTIAWSYGKKPEGCMGFAVYRVDAADGKEAVLPSHAVFPGNEIEHGQTTAEFPVQKFYWKDPYARLVADQTGKNKFRYKIVALEGKPGQLAPMTLPIIISNEIEISPVISDGMKAYFNRGLISTQRVAVALGGKPTKDKLLEQIKVPSNSLRKSLTGDMAGALLAFLDRAKSSGKIYAALYELGDEELIAKLESIGERLSIVLANSIGADPEDPKTKIDANDPARERLEKTAKVIYDRTMPSGHIAHNKFLVYEDDDGNARAVLFGSTNWTSTGLCAQTNNTIVLDNDAAAKRYLAYWKQLASDTQNAGGIAKDLQSQDLRSWNAQGATLKVDGASQVESWFSPNTPTSRKKGKSEKCPADMAQLIELINGAQHALLFLLFYPGTPSLANWTADAAAKNKNLFVRGCVTNKSAAESFYYQLRGMTPPKKVKGQKTPVMQDPRVFGAEAFTGKEIPEGWQHEILNAGFAIIHDKILVIDPFSDQCVVATGSHNLGYKASFDNDENLMIIQGDKRLASAYATHILDVYDHFSFRYWINHSQSQKNYFLEIDPNKWMDKYFDADGRIINAQLKFWMEAVL